ncbi:MAG: 4-hydroxy-tetrahydrodipicolinate synthase [Christensenellales bacterium]|jgi:4-hydroxy-tetrahydrodipicolinate synthase
MFQGSYVALVTPFHPDGTVNVEKLRELCKWHLACGTDGIVALGTTGESSTLTHEEDDLVIHTVMDAVGGKIPVIAGSGSNATETALMKSRTYQDMGVDGLLVLTPYYNKANDTGMYRHFTAVADAVSVPIILYNVPGRTGCALSAPCVEALAKHRNIAGIKEASGSISYAAQIARYLRDDFILLSGNDDMILPILALGGSGVISVFANLCPEESHALCAKWFAGDVAGAREIQLKYLSLINALFVDVNPIPIKEAMNMRGMDVGGYRMPLCEMDETCRAVLARAMQVLGA